MNISNCIEEFFNTFDRKRPIIVFGVGFALNNCLSVLDKNGVEIVGICDNNKDKQNTWLGKYKIMSFEDSQEVFPDAYYIISSPRYFNEIKKQLLLHIAEERICNIDFQNWHYFSGQDYRTYLIENSNRFQKFYERLEDDLSREVLYNITKAHFSGKREDFINAVSTPDDWYLFRTVMKPKEDEVYVDYGAYDGDTVLTFTENAVNGYKKIYALEPDGLIQEKLKENICNHLLKNITILKVGAYSREDTLTFWNNGVYSQISNSNKSCEKSGRRDVINVILLDDLFREEKITMIKMDIGGRNMKH